MVRINGVCTVDNVARGAFPGRSRGTALVQFAPVAQ